jgi:Zn-dependent peptidase ImmA (M78 family)
MDSAKINNKFYLNEERLFYLLKIFRFSEEEFLKLLQGKNKNPVLTKDELTLALKKEIPIKVSILKKIDKIFEKGLMWYVSIRPLPEKNNLSIFFRKKQFNTKLNIGSIKLIDKFEKKKIETEILCDYLDLNYKKELNFSINDDPKEVAKIVRTKFKDSEEQLLEKDILKKGSSDKIFLENLIRNIENFNVFVFEHIDKKRNPEKTIEFDGFFMNPNFIMLKRQQKYLKREIFTLLHEFAHYLINEEEIDTNPDSEGLINNKIEDWCNNFAYFYLIGEYVNEIDSLELANEKNDFYQDFFEEVSKNKHISVFSIYTRLKIINKISNTNYNKIKDRIHQQIKKASDEQFKKNEEQARLKGKTPYYAQPVPIQSKLYQELIKMSYFNGNISEKVALENLNAKNKRIEEVIFR